MKRKNEVFTAREAVTVVGYDIKNKVYLFEHSCVTDGNDELFFVVAFDSVEAIRQFSENVAKGVVAIEKFENQNIDTVH
jgi:hypothetical protein